MLGIFWPGSGSGSPLFLADLDPHRTKTCGSVRIRIRKTGKYDVYYLGKNPKAAAVAVMSSEPDNQLISETIQPNNNIHQISETILAGGSGQPASDHRKGQSVG